MHGDLDEGAVLLMHRLHISTHQLRAMPADQPTFWGWLVSRKSAAALVFASSARSRGQACSHPNLGEVEDLPWQRRLRQQPLRFWVWLLQAFLVTNQLTVSWLVCNHQPDWLVCSDISVPSRS